MNPLLTPEVFQKLPQPAQRPAHLPKQPMTAFVFVPGYGISLGGHWQGFAFSWRAATGQSTGASSDDAELGSWDRPDCALWVARLQAASAPSLSLWC